MKAKYAVWLAFFLNVTYAIVEFIAAGVFGSLSSVLPIAILNLGSESNLIMLILCTIIVFIWGIRNNIRNHQQYVDYIKREFTQKTNSLEQEYNIQRKYLENQIIKET